MTIKERRLDFEAKKHIYESARLIFIGVEGYDVYNCSIPFMYHGKQYIFGRVERRGEWARSWVRLFENTGKDTFTLVPDSMVYQLEDPYVSFVGGQLVMGGTHVRYKTGSIDTYYGYFYKGTDLNDLYYFTTGPDYMKDIRIVELADGRIGVFSRPRHENLEGGAASMIGFTVINSLDELTSEVILNAPYIHGIFNSGEWGGCNQAYLLDSGLIGIIGHMSYSDKDEEGNHLTVYTNCAFVLNPDNRELLHFSVIGTRPCYPLYDTKRPDLVDCAFTSGIVMREDGKSDLYSGIGDAAEGRITIDYPFEGFGKIVSPSSFN